MLLNISQYSSETLQEQIIGQIRARILSGDLGPDEPLTSIRELAQTLRLGVNTVQRAYEHLIREELVYARPGKGYFVAPLNAADKQDVARERFRQGLQSLIDAASREGLSDADVEQLFHQIQKGTK